MTASTTGVIKDNPLMENNPNGINDYFRFISGDWEIIFDPVTLDMVARNNGNFRILTNPGMKKSFMETGKPDRKTNIRQIVFEMTEACNLRCRYCYIDDSGRKRDNKFLEPSSALSCIDMFSKKDFIPRISFFGGEPLLAWKQIKEIVETVNKKAEEKNISPPKYHLTTNATLLTEKKSEYLATHGFSIIVSMDGFKEIHDFARRDARGAPTFDKVMRGLEMLRDSGLAKKITLRATFDGRYFEGRYFLPERAEFLNELCDAGYASWVSVEPAYIGKNHPAAIPFTGERLGVLLHEYDILGDWWINRESAGNNPRLHHIAVPLRRLENKKPADTECGAGKGYLAFDASGNLHACHRRGHPAAKIGDLYSGINQQLQAPWLDNTTAGRSACRKCPIRRVCGGGCRADSLAEYGDILRPLKTACAIRFQCFRQAVKILLARGEAKNS